MTITELSIKRPTLVVVVFSVLAVLGLFSYVQLNYELLPKMSIPVVTITTVYPGASANLIQGFITTPIEQAIASAEGVDYITSSSVQGTSTIQVYIKLNFDPNQALTEVLAKTNSVKYLIPKESNDPIVTKSTGQTTAVMYLGFSSDELSGSAISDYLTRVVQPILSTVDGVASADILGGQTFAMRIWLDPARMAGRGVSPDDIAVAIRANNFQAAAGQLHPLVHGHQPQAVALPGLRQRLRHLARRRHAVDVGRLQAAILHRVERRVRMQLDLRHAGNDAELRRLRRPDHGHRFLLHFYLLRAAMLSAIVRRRNGTC